MNRVKVCCEINTYPDDYKEGTDKIKIHSHWNSRDKVVLDIGGKKITVVGSDLITAVQNCQNTNFG